MIRLQTSGFTNNDFITLRDRAYFEYTTTAPVTSISAEVRWPKAMPMQADTTTVKTVQGSMNLPSGWVPQRRIPEVLNKALNGLALGEFFLGLVDLADTVAPVDNTTVTSSLISPLPAMGLWWRHSGSQLDLEVGLGAEFAGVVNVLGVTVQGDQLFSSSNGESVFTTAGLATGEVRFVCQVGAGLSFGPANNLWSSNGSTYQALVHRVETTTTPTLIPAVGNSDVSASVEDNSFGQNHSLVRIIDASAAGQFDFGTTDTQMAPNFVSLLGVQEQTVGSSWATLVAERRQFSRYMPLQLRALIVFRPRLPRKVRKTTGQEFGQLKTAFEGVLVRLLEDGRVISRTGAVSIPQGATVQIYLNIVRPDGPFMAKFPGSVRLQFS